MRGLETYDSKRILGIIGIDEYLHYYNENEIDKNNTVLIALHDPEKNSHPDSKIEGFEDVLQMHFWDLDSDIGRLKVITQEQADEIREFILKHDDKQFLIHCYAGVSRSAAVACAVGTLLDNVKWKHNDIHKHQRYDPNFLVYNKICNLNIKRLK